MFGEAVLVLGTLASEVKGRTVTKMRNESAAFSWDNDENSTQANRTSTWTMDWKNDGETIINQQSQNMSEVATSVLSRLLPAAFIIFLVCSLFLWLTRGKLDGEDESVYLDGNSESESLNSSDDDTEHCEADHYVTDDEARDPRRVDYNLTIRTLKRMMWALTTAGSRRNTTSVAEQSRDQR